MTTPWPGGAPLGVWLTHDVDRVRKTYQYATDLLSRHRVPDLRPLVRGEDPYFNFGRILDFERSQGVRSTFFFLQETLPVGVRPRTWPRSLGKYRFSDPRVSAAIKDVRHQGWEVGLHGSFRSYRNGGLLSREKHDLELALEEPVHAIRQHYLNLDVPATWELQRATGFKLDASFGNISEVGFPEHRYFPFVNPEAGILVVPLVVSDAAVIRSGWSGAVAKNRIETVLSEALERHALVTVLWHQRHLNPKEFPVLWDLYAWLVAEARTMGGHFTNAAELEKLWGVRQ